MFSESRYSLRMRDIDASLSDIRAVVGAILPIGLRAVSPNGRELVSKHFVVSKDRYKAAADAIERYYAQVTVLGDRRPYDVEILVAHEQRVLRGNAFVYVIAGYDYDLARELEVKVRQELTKRREDRNIIDDFRVF